MDREHLSDTDLSDTDLSDTDLSDTDLSDTDLSDTDLSDTDLSDTDLSQRLLEAETRPDGGGVRAPAKSRARTRVRKDSERRSTRW